MRMTESATATKRSWKLGTDGPPLLAVAIVFAALVAIAVGASQPILAAGILGLLLFVVTCLEFLAWLRQTRIDRLAAEHDADTLHLRLRAAEKQRLQEPWI